MSDHPLSDLIHSDDDFLPTKALVMVAHPDDVDFGAAGTVATLTDHGVEVVYGVATSGEAGEPDHISPEELGALRRAEQTAAASVVGVDELHWLGFQDGALEANLELRKAISRVIRIVRPDLVIAQTPERNWDSIYASHPDHLAMGEATVAAVYPDSRNASSFPELLAEGHEPHSVPRMWLMAGNRNNHHVDITEQFDRKIKALLAHDSQVGPRAAELPDMLREWAAANAADSGSGFEIAESFQVVVAE